MLELQVQPKHVKEAYRLLNKSIIRVETPDIQFDEENEPQGISLLGFKCYYVLYRCLLRLILLYII